MSRFLMKPKIDFAFKEIMANDRARLGFLSAVLGLDPKDVKETRILNVELRREHEDDKQGILDVHIMLNSEVEIDVEIQVAEFLAWTDRSLFYAAKMFSGQLRPGDTYRKLSKCVSISILDFSLFPNEREFYSRFHLWEDKRRLLYTDKLEFHVIELPKLPEASDEREDALLLWARFINSEREEDFEMIAKRDVYVDAAYEQLKVISQDREKRLAYEAREKAVRDHAQLMFEADQRGHKRGLEEGRAKGRAEGRAEGKAEGQIFGIVKMCKKYGVSLADAVSNILDAIPNMSREDAEAQVKALW